MTTSSFNAPSLIERKREGGTLSPSEIGDLVAAFTSGEMSDAQMSAFAMAVYFQGMNAEETGSLTRAMLASGGTLHYPEGSPPKIDKHSTGGIGDKVSLVLAPLLAADGSWIPMISGRGLGITGGTLDKLESIPGFRVDLDGDEINAALEACGCVITGQTTDLCPADRKLYALRDVTGTVPSIPLIVSSIMSKKLAENLDRLVLDVKYGSGAFMKTKAEAEVLGKAMAEVGTQFGVRTRYLLSPMEEPLGKAVGNALEVVEAIETLRGGGPSDLRQLVLDLAETVSDSGRGHLEELLDNGRAYTVFEKMVTAQGGDAASLATLADRHRAAFVTELRAIEAGCVQAVSAEEIGRVVLEMGGGRRQAGDKIDHAVGIDRLVKVGEEIAVGDVLMRVHAPSKERLARTSERLLGSIEIG